jgi:hypothetical protein
VCLSDTSFAVSPVFFAMDSQASRAVLKRDLGRINCTRDKEQHLHLPPLTTRVLAFRVVEALTL